MKTIAVHGWCFGSEVWDELASHLPGLQTWALPGYGNARPSPTSLAALAEQLLAELPEEPVNLIGWSLGALVTLHLAAHHPQRVRRLALFGATASFVARPGWPHAVAPEQLADFQAALAADPAALRDRFALLCNQGDVDARRQSRFLRALPLPAADVLATGLDLLANADLRPLLPQVSAPVLLLHGVLDPLMPIAGARALATALPQARLEALLQRAHAPFLGGAPHCAACLAAFFAA